MATPTSEYRIPIFISSTDYNLKDLRKELSRYLSELGYQPMLSSEEGFHDSSPDKEPWESCLEVLGTCPIMILIIDNRYGNKFAWKNYSKIITEKISPTHAEYLFAHAQQKRLLVFIREEILQYYQSYRQVKKDVGEDNEEIKKRIVAVLPKNSHIEYEVFPFIEKVKTAMPIPWIREFKDVTDLKREIHKKLLNELAVVFLIKDRQTEVVTAALSKILQESSEQKRREILERMGVTRELMEKYEAERSKVGELSAQMQKLAVEGEDYKTQLIGLQKSAEKDEAKIRDLQTKLKETQTEWRASKEAVDLLNNYSNRVFSSLYDINDKYSFHPPKNDLFNDFSWNLSKTLFADDSTFNLRASSIGTKRPKERDEPVKTKKEENLAAKVETKNENNGKNNMKPGDGT
jgi:hypothetical protein